MTPAALSRTARGIAILLAVAGLSPAFADRLHLDSGGVIVTDRWWIEGDWLHYESAGAGTVGLPRAVVVRIEKAEPGASTGGASTAGASSGPGSAAGVGPDNARPAAPLVSPPVVINLDEQPGALPDEAETGQLVSLDTKKAFDAAGAALTERDFEAASAGFRAIVGANPELHAARAGYIISEMQLGRDGVAMSIVLDGLARYPEHAELRELLGDLRDREDRIEDALREWNDAFQKKPSDRLREKILRAQRELQAGADYDQAATVHFNLRYDGDVDQYLAQQVMNYLEEQYWILSDRFRHAPPQPITVQLYPTKEFREVTRSPDWVGGLYDGKIRVPLGGLSRLDSRAQAVLVHELTHAVVHSKTRGDCPRWLQEGLAQRADGHRTTPAETREVHEILGRGSVENWETAGFSYPAALSLVGYLESERGEGGLIWLLDALGEGVGIEKALQRTYGRSYAELCRAWADEVLRGRR